MAPRTTNFYRTGAPDPSLAQNASTLFDAAERQVIDQQITDMQKLLATVLANGVVGTYAKIDANSPAISAGDFLCKATGSLNTWTLATPSALVAAGGVPAGIALAASQPNSRCPVATSGIIDPVITGISLSPQVPCRARLSSSGRVEAVNSYTVGDTPVGSINAKGWLTLALGGGADIGATTTTDATPTVLIEVPFGANASASGTISILATSADAHGAYTYFSAGGLIYTSGGALAFAGSPLESTCTTFSPDSPSWSPNYDVASQKLQIIGTGLAGATVTWQVKFDAFTVIG